MGAGFLTKESEWQVSFSILFQRLSVFSPDRNGGYPAHWQQFPVDSPVNDVAGSCHSLGISGNDNSYILVRIAQLLPGGIWLIDTSSGFLSVRGFRRRKIELRL